MHDYIIIAISFALLQYYPPYDILAHDHMIMHVTHHTTAWWSADAQFLATADA